MYQILFPNQIFHEIVRELNGEYGLRCPGHRELQIDINFCPPWHMVLGVIP